MKQIYTINEFKVMLSIDNQTNSRVELSFIENIYSFWIDLTLLYHFRRIGETVPTIFSIFKGLLSISITQGIKYQPVNFKF